MARTAWQAAVEALEAEGVRYAFGLPGNPLHLVADLDGSSVTPILARNESSAVFMAYGYARVSREVGVCFGNPGPGTTNMVSGMLEADSACVPVVALSNGTVSRFDGAGALQELDVMTLMRPVTKWSSQLRDPAAMPWLMRRAFHVARNGRPGSVFVEVPGDLGLREAEIEDYRSAGPRLRARPSSDAVEALADAARRVGAAGHRRRLGRLVGRRRRRAARAWRRRVGAGVLTTPGGRGSFPEEHALALGQMGLYFTSAGPFRVGRRRPRAVASARGSRSCRPARARASSRPAPRYAQIDADPFAIARNVVPDVGLVGDAALALEDVLAALRARGAGRLGPGGVARRRSPRARRETAADVERARADRRGPVFGGQLVGEIERVFGPRTILAHENGGHDLWSYYSPYYRVQEGGISIPPGEQTVMGIARRRRDRGEARAARPARRLHVAATARCRWCSASSARPCSTARRSPGSCSPTAASRWPQFIGAGDGAPAGRRPTSSSAPTSSRRRGRRACTPRRVTHGDDVRDALDRARQANEDGVPALVEVAVARHEYAPGFVSFHRDVWGLGQRAAAAG